MFFMKDCFQEKFKKLILNKFKFNKLILTINNL